MSEEFRGPESYRPIESLDAALRLPLTFTERRRGKPPRHLADLTLAERKDVLSESGLPGYRADQLSRHYFAHLTRSAEEMTDLPAQDREEMVAALLPELATEVRRLSADDGATVKTLLELFDGTRIESVLMAYPGRNTVCISSEVGCGMACPFCATG
nr:23S rRNA (adenine(2503)-C(2))-methyltransferase RlmN [Actinomycetales bacterium]